MLRGLLLDVLSAVVAIRIPQFGAMLSPCSFHRMPTAGESGEWRDTRDPGSSPQQSCTWSSDRVDMQRGLGRLGFSARPVSGLRLGAEASP